MKKFFLFVVICLFSITISRTFAQNAPTRNPFACGMSAEDARENFKYMNELRARYPQGAQLRAIAYVPVYFHLVAKDDATGRISESNVLDMLCEWNRLYTVAGLELQFYIKGFTYINKTTLYDAPKSFGGGQNMTINKKLDGMNIFITNNAGDGTSVGTVLGYYDRNSDWIVLNKTEISTAGAGTIAHEAGHFFTLNHTFYGWEEAGPFVPTANTPCAPRSVTYSGQSFEVETVARTGATANCSRTGDGFCDTPEDYNFGFGASATCTFNTVAKDPDCVAVNPDETNLMSYFLNCSSKIFSPQQKTAITTDYANGTKHAYLRPGNITPVQTVNASTVVSPALGATTPYYNNVQLDWTDAAGAIGYIVEISTNQNFTINNRIFNVTTSDLNINSNNVGIYLSTDRIYYWRVRSYGAYKTCATTLSGTSNFRTSSLNATIDIPGVTQFTIAPNPVTNNEKMLLAVTAENPFDATMVISNIAGQVQATENLHFDIGYTQKAISINNFTNGFYILSLKSDKGILTKRIVVQK